MSRGLYSVEEVDTSVERRILIGAITSSDFVMELQNLLKPENFKGEIPKIMIDWVMRYYRDYQKAPGENIKSLLDYETMDWEVDEARVCQSYLKRLSKDFVALKNFNPVHAANEAYPYLKENAIRHKIKRVDKMLDKGEIDEAADSMEKIPQEVYRESDTSLTLSDTHEFISSFYGKTIVPLFEFSEPLRHVLPPACIKRTNIFLGPGKRGKSFWLQRVAEEAMLNGFNVIYYSLEMPKEQMAERFAESLTGRDHYEDIEPRTYLVPTWDCTKNKKCTCDNCQAYEALPDDAMYQNYKDHVPCSICKEEDPENYEVDTWMVPLVRRTMSRNDVSSVLRHVSRKGGNIKIEDKIHNINAMRANARRHIANGYSAKVVIIDYGDIAEGDAHYKELRHESTAVWRAMSRWGKEDGLSMWSATQGTRGAFSADRLLPEHIAENIEVARIIDGLIGINSCGEAERDLYKRDSTWKRQMLERIICRYAPAGKQALMIGDFERSVTGFDGYIL